MKVKYKVPTKMSWNSYVPAVKIGTAGVCWKWTAVTEERRRAVAAAPRVVGGAPYAPGGNGGDICGRLRNSDYHILPRRHLTTHPLPPQVRQARPALNARRVGVRCHRHSERVHNCL